MRIIADITDPDIIHKILDHIEAQPPPNKPVAAIQSWNILGETSQITPTRYTNLFSDQPGRL
jgi:hypothetical protein